MKGRPQLDPRRDATSTGSSRSAAAVAAGARGDRGRRRAARHPDRRPPHRPGPRRSLAGGRRRIVEVGTAYGYSTLWMALGQPADGTIVTIDPDRERTDLARGWWREAGIADERITVVDGQGPRRVRGRRPGPRRAVRPGLHRRAQARVRGLPRRADRRPPAPRRARRRRQRPVERSRVGRHGRSSVG